MRIEIKDNQGNARLTVHVDPAAPPTVVRATDGRGPAVSLDWDRALDDQDRLRHCPVCSCPDLYIRNQVPRLTVFALIVAAGCLASVFYGLGHAWPALTVLVLVVALDIVIWRTAPRRLVCYRCGTEFHDTPAPARCGPWNARLAQGYPPSPAPPPSPPSPPEPAADPPTDPSKNSPD